MMNWNYVQKYKLICICCKGGGGGGSSEVWRGDQLLIVAAGGGGAGHTSYCKYFLQRLASFVY